MFAIRVNEAAAALSPFKIGWAQLFGATVLATVAVVRRRVFEVCPSALAMRLRVVHRQPDLGRSVARARANAFAGRSRTLALLLQEPGDRASSGEADNLVGLGWCVHFWLLYRASANPYIPYNVEEGFASDWPI